LPYDTDKFGLMNSSQFRFPETCFKSRKETFRIMRSALAGILFLGLIFSVPVTLAKTVADSRVILVSDQIHPEKEKADRPNILFLISEDPHNYEAHKTIPRFAEMLKREHDFETTVLMGEGELTSFHFPGLSEAISEADLLVIFFRRIALPAEQLEAIRQFLDNGNPLAGIRTANHAFSVRESDGTVPEGYKDWWDFVPDILGCENQGYGPVELGTRVNVVSEMADHPILEGQRSQWHSTGNVYHNQLLDDNATVLMTGTVDDQAEPVAWARYAGESRVFYTSLGHPADFGVSYYRTLLVNGIKWGLGHID
jgi:type 1 glutamine amidotransferase